MSMATMSGRQPGMGSSNGRADNNQENTKQEDLLIQKYRIPRQNVQAPPPEVSKVTKSLPFQVSEATVKPPQSLIFHCVLGATSHHKKSFMAASAPASSLAAPVLEPGHHYFLLQGGVCYGGQVHTVIH